MMKRKTVIIGVVLCAVVLVALTLIREHKRELRENQRARENTVKSTVTPTPEPTTGPTTTPAADPTTAPSITAGPKEGEGNGTYHMMFLLNGGTGNIADGEKTHDAPYIFPEALPVKKGYNFTGWYVEDDPDTRYMPGDAYNGNGNTFFYAGWKLIESTDDPDSGLNRITLSGKRDDHVITDRYSYIEYDKFFLLLDKDIDLPGDFGDNVALIIDTLEEELGITYDCTKKLLGVDPSTDEFFKPWKDISFGLKIPIYVGVDREVQYLVPGADACGRYVLLYEYELYSEEFWNSVPEYRDHPFGRYDFILYSDLAHELTHCLVSRYYQCVTWLMSEGPAEYFAELTVKALADVNEDFRKSYERLLPVKSYYVTVKVNAESAEKVIAEDFQSSEFENRDDVYVLGRAFCEFLAENYGNGFMLRYLDGAKERGLRSMFSYTEPRNEPEKHAELLKELFGADLYVRFGKWYVKKKAQ